MGTAKISNHYNRYAKIESGHLRKMYSQKFVKLQTLRGGYMGWFAQREATALEGQMKAIEAELAARDAQLALF